MISKYIEKIKKNPPLLLFLAYFLIILAGSIILMLPISSINGKFTPFTDAFFTSASAFCVTGLVQFTTATYWTLFGKVVILILIQAGGLGVMTLAGLLALVTNQRISLNDRQIIKEETNSQYIGGIVKHIKWILKSTFIIEGAGAIILAFIFSKDYGILRGIWYGIFHSISAYCNAGFDILGEVSLSKYGGNIIFVLSISSLIVLAGLGFRVYKDVLEHKEFKKFSLHTKIVLKVTIILILVGAISTLLLEWNNPQTLGGENIFTKILQALMQSVTTRTAGFYTINQEYLTNRTAFLSIILMFIGGSPAGTAGGLKTTTFATLLGFVEAEIKNKDDIVIMNKRLPKTIAKRAVSITVAFLVWVFVASFLLLISEEGAEPLNVFFEVVSAIATVGLTRGLSPLLTTFGKYIISITMIFGKAGPLSIIYAFGNRNMKKHNFKEAEESIIIG